MNLENDRGNRFGLCGQGNGKGMLPDDLLWLTQHIYTNFTQFDVLDYFLGSLREDVPHRVKLVKMAKIKKCVNQVVSLEICTGGTP